LGDNDLILGAFGCGSFQNDPQLVAGVFKDVLQSTEFATAFKNIYFSITDLKQTEVFATALADQSHPLVKQG
jgi:uncharacterized protein (TIGR02452 family)